MKIIDILNKMADGTLEDGFKFKYDDYIWKYEKEYKSIYNKDNRQFGLVYNLGNYLTDEVEVIEGVKKIEEIEIKEDYNRDEFITSAAGEKIYIDNITEEIIINKINELVRAVNKLRKDKSNDI